MADRFIHWPAPNQFPEGWQGMQARIRFMLDQVDELAKRIESGELKGNDAATELQLLTASVTSDANAGALFYTEEASHGDSRSFWKYALKQAEKALDAFGSIQEIPREKEQARIFKGQRSNSDDHVQFFRTACHSGIEAALALDTGPNPHVGRR